jgi:hypothetical protein
MPLAFLVISLILPLFLAFMLITGFIWGYFVSVVFNLYWFLEGIVSWDASVLSKGTMAGEKGLEDNKEKDGYLFSCELLFEILDSSGLKVELKPDEEFKHWVGKDSRNPIRQPRSLADLVAGSGQQSLRRQETKQKLAMAMSKSYSSQHDSQQLNIAIASAAARPTASPPTLKEQEADISSSAPSRLCPDVCCSCAKDIRKIREMLKKQLLEDSAN